MEIKLRELYEKIKNTDRRLLVFLIIGICGIVLILLSEVIPGGANKPEQSKEYSYEAYITELENKTEEVISSINGVGRCKVMITIKNTNESVYAKNNEENKKDGNYSRKYEYVLYDGQEGDEPILIKQYFPEIQGVVIVCDGADSEAVRESITESVSALYGVSASNISVSKYKG
ncbi:MAG: hypothetical protein IJT65_06110 [Eubacterium sp.]|nr:hypothetical protein [Eubacterium sp.]